MEPSCSASCLPSKNPRRWRSPATVAVAALALLSFSMAGSDAAGESPQQPSFRARTLGVRVDVLVQQRGKGIAGLTRDRFRLWDNGVEQRVEVLSNENIPVDLIIVYDTSGSVQGITQDRLRSATQSVAALLRPQDRAALVAVADTVQVAVGLTPKHELLMQPLQSLPSGGRTRLRDGIFAGAALSTDQGVRPLVLVLSDGKDTGSWLDGADLLALCDRSDATIYVVLMGTSTSSTARDRAVLKDVALRSGGRLLVATSVEDVGEAFQQVLSEFNSRYVLSFSPEPATAGWHTLRVSVTGASANTIAARRGYWLEK